MKLECNAHIVCKSFARSPALKLCQGWAKYSINISNDWFVCFQSIWIVLCYLLKLRIWHCAISLLRERALVLIKIYSLLNFIIGVIDIILVWIMAPKDSNQIIQLRYKSLEIIPINVSPLSFYIQIIVCTLQMWISRKYICNYFNFPIINQLPTILIPKVLTVINF